MSAGDQQMVDAMVRSNADIGRLRRLIAAGRVTRQDGEYERRHPEVARRFLATVQGVAEPPARRAINLAIKPKKRRR